MTEPFEAEIRQALDAKAYEVEVPSELATQTIERIAAVEARQPLLHRWKARRDAKRMRYPADRRSRWLIGTGAIAGAAALLVVGMFVTKPTGMDVAETAGSGFDEGYDYRIRRGDVDTVEPYSEKDPGDAVAGKVAGVTSSGDASGSNSASQLTGLTAGSASTGVGKGAGTGGAEPQLVRAADIRVAVEEFDDAWNDAHDLVADHGGDVVNLRTSLEGEAAEGTLRIRVPSDQLDPLITDLRRLGTLASLRTTGDDIADQVDATKKKLATQKKALDEANTAGEQERIDFLQGDVKRLEKKQDGLEEQVEFSFVNATLYQDEDAARSGSSMIGTAARTSGQLALTVLAGILVVGGVLAPMALVALVIWFVVRTLRRRRGN